jgi:hypothetical protein
MLRRMVMSSRRVLVGLVAGVLTAGSFAAVAAVLRIDEQPVYCPVPPGEVTPACPGPYGEASTCALLFAAVLGFLLAFAVVATVRRRHKP